MYDPPDTPQPGVHREPIGTAPARHAPRAPRSIIVLRLDQDGAAPAAACMAGGSGADRNASYSAGTPQKITASDGMTW